MAEVQLSERVHGADQREAHARKIAHLMPPWPKGVSGNPKGRPARGLAIDEAANIMGEWDDDRVQAVLDDPKASKNKKAAARHVQGMAEQGWGSNGKPLAMEDLREALDRGLGKPTQSILAQVITTEVKRIVLVDEVIGPGGDQPELTAATGRSLEYIDQQTNTPVVGPSTRASCSSMPDQLQVTPSTGACAVPALPVPAQIKDGGTPAPVACPVSIESLTRSSSRAGKVQGKPGSIEAMCQVQIIQRPKRVITKSVKK